MKSRVNFCNDSCNKISTVQKVNIKNYKNVIFIEI